MENEHDSQAGNSKPVLLTARMEKLVLASSSPRRAEILQSVGWEFQARAVAIDETPLLNEAAIDYVKRLALQKAQATAALTPNELVLGADTTVVVDGDILAKPFDEHEARAMLRRLSGRWHEVLTGVALVRNSPKKTESVAYETTRVLFAEMLDEEIDGYVATGEPMGKAGAYGIQGSAALFIDRIEGDYWNVVGLPVRLVYKMACGL